MQLRYGFSLVNARVVDAVEEQVALFGKRENDDVTAGVDSLIEKYVFLCLKKEERKVKDLTL
jgi:hypothetical protein